MKFKIKEMKFKLLKQVIITASLAMTLTIFASAHGVPSTILDSIKPNKESLHQYKYPEWFRDAKFGFWAHWGPQAVPRQGDWYARKMYQQGSDDYKYHVAHYGHPSKFGYKDIIPLWKAKRWDPEKLMKL